MSNWITAAGITSVGIVYGYILFYTLKRYMPPISQQLPATRELIFLITSLAGGGAIGSFVASMNGVNYIGPYGIGLLVGATLNVLITYLIYSK